MWFFIMTHSLFSDASTGNASHALEDLILHSDVYQSFCTIITTRRSCHIPDSIMSDADGATSDLDDAGGGFQVDLDSADFDFTVGEIERLVFDEREVPDALDKIDALAKTLGTFIYHCWTFMFTYSSCYLICVLDILGALESMSTV